MSLTALVLARIVPRHEPTVGRRRPVGHPRALAPGPRGWAGEAAVEPGHLPLHCRRGKVKTPGVEVLAAYSRTIEAAMRVALAASSPESWVATPTHEPLPARPHLPSQKVLGGPLGATTLLRRST